LKRPDSYRDVYGRMAWKDVAPTITGGCTNPSKGRFIHPEEDRPITLREAALLQTFPPRYRFSTGRGKDAVALMIGNALPPEFIRRQAVQYRAHLQEVERG
ncbi:DNA cytosine methyltransferase, partial [Burkholderia pseudomallei]